MRTFIKLTLIFCFCLVAGTIFAQNQDCVEDFENQTTSALAITNGNWNGISGRVAFETDVTTNGTQILRGKDGSGSSWMTNIVDYSGNWIQDGRCELCFDIRYVPGPNNPAIGFNAITIFQNNSGNPGNTNPQNAAINATFKVINPIGSEWVRVCVPISQATGSDLPSNALGEWVGPSVGDWNTLIQNVSGIAFRLDFGGGANPAEDVYVDNICFDTCPGGNDCNLGTDCTASNQVNFTTGVDASGNPVAPGLGVVDQSWQLINNPPLVGCGNPIQNTINGSAYLMNHNGSGANSWANQAGATTLAPVDIGTASGFGCNNIAIGGGAVVPYIFDRLFCVCQDEEVKMDLTFKGDDTLHLELIDLISNTVIATSPGYRYPNPAQNFTYSGFLPAGSYALRAYLMNTNSTTLGFSVVGSMTNASGKNTILSEGACCVSDPLVITKILDYNCNGRIDDGDEVGAGWRFDVTDATGGLVASGQTNTNGNLIINDLAAGTYTVTEINQSGWTPGNPSSGSMTVNVTDSLNQVYFFNCPKPCGAIVRDTVQYACEDQASLPYTFYLQNDSGQPVTSVLIKPITPAGTTITPNFFNLFQNPIADGTVYGPLTVDLNLTGPITQATEVCFEVIYLSKGEECCKFTHCVTILPTDPCENVSVRAIASSDENGACCYTLELKNDFCPDYFTSVITEIITPGVVFGSFNGGSSWTGAMSANQQVINWRPNNNSTIPLGSLGNMDFCLDSINRISQLPQEVVVHWMVGREIVCSDTLRFDCNPCAFIELEEGICNDDGSVSFNYTIFNTSGRTVTEFYLEAQTPNIQFNPAFVTATIPDGTSYSGTFTVSTLDNTPLTPGAIIGFKATLFDGTEWCCHMGGLSLEIPDCDGCECGDEEEWRKLFDQGFQSKIDCEEGIIQFKTEMTECDSVIFNIYDATGLIASVSGVGSQILTLPILPNGGYIVEMIAYRYDENGELCFEAVKRYDLGVDCPKEACDCEDESFFDAVNAGPEFDIDCERGEIRVRTKMTQCDVITLRILGPNNQILFEDKFQGDQTLTFPILPNGTYTVEMEVFRLDEDGNVCMESIFLGKLEIDCPEEDCCGDEAQFLADVNAGFDVDFICNGINGPVMTVKPNQAKACDRIIWNVYTREGDLIYSDTTSGTDGFSINVPGLPSFVIEYRWDRLNADGKSCFGQVVGRRDIRNECDQTPGVIDMNLVLKAPDQVVVTWSVESKANYDEYIIVRSDQQDSKVLAKIPAEIGKHEYVYNDRTAEEGENAYIVFGLIQNIEIGKSTQDRVEVRRETVLDVRLSPNPTFDQVDLNTTKTGNYQVLIRDQNGRIYHSQKIELQKDTPKRLDVSSYPDGILLLQLIHENGEVTTKRLVKLH
ncbi:MAG: hypothetical protein Sapg2KO_52850 [Saprospiraceae bacterium]